MSNATYKVAEPIARTPLRGAPTQVIDGREYQQGATSGDLLITDLSMTKKTQYRQVSGQSADLGVPYGEAKWTGNTLVVGSGPGEWMVIESAGAGAPEEVPGTRHVDLSNGRAMIRVSGKNALELMRRVSAFNYDDRLFPNHAAARTSVAAVTTDVIRDDVGGEPSFILHVERSSGIYLQEMLLEAGAEFGATIGQASPDFAPAD
ncbi:hypothetical protein [Micrococcoides hystricis]|uniref:Sarcosine oxidase subunit gamma n=1 Tax=Micrococcoides hystricis TaxID=1572761 RepID=A0ABV6PA13_9MICC